MKYTNYIINGNLINVDQLISDKKILKEISILISLPVAITGLAVFTSIVPLTVVIDGARALKYEYYQLQKKYKKI